VRLTDGARQRAGQVDTKPASDILAGAVARAASQSTIHPLDTLKVRMQARGGVSKFARLVPPAGTAPPPPPPPRGVAGVPAGGLPGLGDTSAGAEGAVAHPLPCSRRGAPEAHAGVCTATSQRA